MQVGAVDIGFLHITIFYVSTYLMLLIFLVSGRQKKVDNCYVFLFVCLFFGFTCSININYFATTIKLIQMSKGKY